MKIKPSYKSITEIEPYVPGSYAKPFDGRQIKLSSNENPMGCADKVKIAISQNLDKLNRYPDGSCVKLREKIGAFYNVDAERVVCGAGSDEIITLICMAFAAGDGNEIIHTEHGFLMYPISALSIGATPIAAKEKNLKADVDQILSKVTDKTKLVFIANPNNPTGSYLRADEINDLRERLNDDVILVIDNAYGEYVEDLPDYPVARELVEKYENVIMTSTFSKIFGIPSLRLGWAYASKDVVDILNRVRGPFNVNGLAQLAGIAALDDKEFLEQSRIHNNKWLDLMSREIKNFNLTVYPSIANFVLVEFEAKQKARFIFNYLKDRGISTRLMDAYKLPSCIRISIGLENENEIFLQELHNALKNYTD